MNEEGAASPGRRGLRRRRRRVAAIVVAAPVVSLTAVWISDPAHDAPHEIDLWGHAFTADGEETW